MIPSPTAITTVASNWPPGESSILPGGFTVFNNTLVILGGFDIPNGVGTDQIWQFTPNPPAGCRRMPSCQFRSATYQPPPSVVSSTQVAALISRAAL